MNERSQVPLLIAIEGIDGAGKTTIANMISRTLRDLGFAVCCSKEPTQGAYGQQLRDSAATGRLPPEREIELLLLDRREHVINVIAPALEAKSIVILDRYYFSNAAYQGAEGLEPRMILARNESFAPRADLVLLLDVSPEIGLSRIEKRGDFANKFEQPDALRRCRDIFLKIDRPEIRRVDASMELKEVFMECMQHVVAAFANKATKLYGMTPEGAEVIRPLLKDAFK